MTPSDADLHGAQYDRWWRERVSDEGEPGVVAREERSEMPPVRVPKHRYEVVYVQPDGNPHVYLRTCFVLNAFELAEALRAEAKEKHQRMFVGVGDREDPELGWLSEDDYCERCGARLVDDACPVHGAGEETA